MHQHTWNTATGSLTPSERPCAIVDVRALDRRSTISRSVGIDPMRKPWLFGAAVFG